MTKEIINTSTQSPVTRTQKRKETVYQNMFPLTFVNGGYFMIALRGSLHQSDDRKGTKLLSIKMYFSISKVNLSKASTPVEPGEASHFQGTDSVCNLGQIDVQRWVETNLLQDGFCQLFSDSFRFNKIELWSGPKAKTNSEDPVPAEKPVVIKLRKQLGKRVGPEHTWTENSAFQFDVDTLPEAPAPTTFLVKGVSPQCKYFDQDSNSPISIGFDNLQETLSTEQYLTSSNGDEYAIHHHTLTKDFAYRKVIDFSPFGFTKRQLPKMTNTDIVNKSREHEARFFDRNL